MRAIELITRSAGGIETLQSQSEGMVWFMATQNDTADNATAALELTRDEARLILKSLFATRNGRRYEFRTGDGKTEKAQAPLLAMLDSLDERLRATFEL